MTVDPHVRWSARAVVALVLVAGSLLGVTGPGAAAEADAADGPAAPDATGAPADRFREPRIVGGSVAPAGAWPGQAALLVNAPDGTYFTCGGTVIDRSWVLTAAHCVNRPDPDPADRWIARPGDIDVLVGTQDLRTGGTRIPAVEIRVVPGWDYARLANDVALIRLDRPVPGGVVPVALAGTNPVAGADVTAVGWGDTAYGNGTGTPVLRQVELDVVSDGGCSSFYPGLYRASSMVCVNRDPAGTCQGDSGGPTFELRSGVWTQIGITSWAAGCGEGYPSVLARIPTFSTWIRWQVRYGPQPTAAAFVKRQYLDLFGRQPTGAELFYGVAALEDGQSTASFVAQLLDGATYRGRSGGIVRLYQAIFERLPETGGMTYWMGEITRGVALKRIADLMVRAPEFTTLYGGTDDAAFVALVYDHVLGRTPSVDEAAYWVDELASGRRTRGQVMVGFSESPEYKAQTAVPSRTWGTGWALLRRVPTPTELANWGPLSTGDLARLLLTSWSYANRF